MRGWAREVGRRVVAIVQADWPSPSVTMKRPEGATARELESWAIAMTPASGYSLVSLPRPGGYLLRGLVRRMGWDVSLLSGHNAHRSDSDHVVEPLGEASRPSLG